VLGRVKGFMDFNLLQGPIWRNSISTEKLFGQIFFPKPIDRWVSGHCGLNSLGFTAQKGHENRYLLANIWPLLFLAVNFGRNGFTKSTPDPRQGQRHRHWVQVERGERK
jgi:hypothetical protein